MNLPAMPTLFLPKTYDREDMLSTNGAGKSGYQSVEN
jgi:hypothetical protein